MAKKIIVMIMVLAIFTIPLTAYAEDVDITNWGYVYGTRDISTGTLSNWVTGQAYDTLPWDVELTLPARTLLYVSSLDFVTDKSPFEQFYTYHFTYSLTTNDNISSWTLAHVKTSTYAGMAQYRQNPLDKGTDINSVFDFSSVYVKNTSTSNVLKLDVIFSVTEQMDYCTILPMFLYANASTSSITGMKLQLDSFVAVRDYDQEFYNSQSMLLQQEIKDSITDGFTSVNGNLDDIENLLTDAPNYTPETNSLNDDISELESIENQINEEITKPISLPDGTQLQVDANTFLNLQDWWKSYYEAPEYESTVGLLFADFFELFMPYLGTAIFVSLVLGLIIAFLTGRRIT